MMEYISLMVVSYLMGSIPFGKIIAAKYGVDIQRQGSGNIGFANVYRVVGHQPAALVLVLDVIKGILAAVLIHNFVSSLDMQLIIAFSAVIGHVFPVWLRFHGGKGVATTLGILLILIPIIGLVSLGVYALALGVFRKFPLASLFAAVSLPIMAVFVAPGDIWFCIFLTIFCFWTHRSNIASFRKLRHSAAA
jgi:glycerol-3-phosphate acyltransferase PlsY